MQDTATATLPCINATYVLQKKVYHYLFIHVPHDLREHRHGREGNVGDSEVPGTAVVLLSHGAQYEALDGGRENGQRSSCP